MYRCSSVCILAPSPMFLIIGSLFLAPITERDTLTGSIYRRRHSPHQSPLSVNFKRLSILLWQNLHNVKILTKTGLICLYKNIKKRALQSESTIYASSSFSMYYRKRVYRGLQKTVILHGWTNIRSLQKMVILHGWTNITMSTPAILRAWVTLTNISGFW